MYVSHNYDTQVVFLSTTMYVEMSRHLGMNDMSTHQGWGTRTRYSYSQYSSTEFLVLVLYSYSWVRKS